MALVLRDRVKETTSTSGTGSITLLGPVQGFQGFSTIGDGNTTYYTIVAISEWEVGIGTYSAGILTRDTVLASSDGGAKVGFSTGIKDVFCTLPSAKALVSDAIPLAFAFNTTAPNDTVNVASLTSAVASTNGDLALVAKGNGAVVAQIPTGTLAGGNKRGQRAVDFQMIRLNADEVASGENAVLVGGYANKSTALQTTVVGGAYNKATATRAAVLGGADNVASGLSSAIVGGIENTVSNSDGFIGAGRGNIVSGDRSGIGYGLENTASGEYSSIVGGRSNVASGAYAITGAGRQNTASGNYSIVTGGYLNTSSVEYATVVGGKSNAASAGYVFIGGGDSNAASALYAVIGGGQSNTSSGLWATIGGGVTNTASNSFATIAGGASNQATSTSATVGGGSGNVASGASATISGGSTNTANSSYSYISGGAYGNTRGIVGYHAFPACNAPVWDDTGKSQKGLLIIGTRTTNATPVVLRSDTASAGTTNQLILPNNSAYFVEGAVIANVTGAGNTKSWQFTAQIKRGANAASTVLTGFTVTSPYGDAGASAWVVALSADTTNGGLAVTVTGQASTTIRWVCKLETTEVAF